MWLWWLAGGLLLTHLAIAFILMGSVINLDDTKSNADILQELLMSFVVGLIWPIAVLMTIRMARAIDKLERENGNNN